MAAASLAFAFAADAQRISIGVIGGTNITANFPVTDYSGPADDFGNPAYRFQHLSGPRSFIVGGLIEGRLSDSFSIEANVLHRPLKRTIIFTTFDTEGAATVSTQTSTAVRAWEFPILLKYALPKSRFSGPVRPFVAAGPAFRTQEDAGAAEPSRLGISAGVGAAIHLGRFRVEPTLRYTRWRREDIAPRYDTKPDQLEFLTSFAYETHADSRRVAGRKLEIGLLAGLPLTHGLEEPITTGTFDERTGYLLGLSAQMAVKGDWSLEVNAIYKPFRVDETQDNYRGSFAVLTWQFPVLAKYRWTRTGWTPFVAAGPSFRLAGNLNGYDPSHIGATVGAGVERIAHGFRLSPALRYTLWANDDAPRSISTRRNAVEVVLGVSF